MNCVICGSTKVRYYFTRHFEGVWGQMLDKSEYHQCQNCGFVFSKTLFEMDSEKWAELNVNLHTYGEKLAKSNLDEYLTHGNQPPYLAQAAMINLLIKNDIIDSAVLRVADETRGAAIEMGGGGNSTPEFKKFAHSNSNLNASYQTINPSLAKHLLSHFSPKNSHYKHFIIANMIDYAGGIGSLARILQDYYGIALPVFEKYMNECIVDGKVCYVDERHLEKYDAVFNSAMFEHITKREHLEHINSLVKDDGILIIHTVVRQNIPKNPQWFYVIPVHCAFHTNDSMQILMQQWGYTQSLYSPIAKSWVLFKKDNKNCINGSLKDFATKINKELEMKYFYHKDGFVDYWVD